MTDRKKILMITAQLGYGGAGTSFIRLANFLAQTMDVSVAIFGDHRLYGAGQESLGVPVLKLDGTPQKGWLTRWLNRIRQVRALKLQHDVTISFLSGPNLLNVVAGSNARTVVSLRGSRFYDPVAPKFQRFLFRYLFDPIIFHCAAAIVPVSDGLTHEIRRMALPKTLAKVHVISPFIESDVLQRRLAESPAEPYETLRGQRVVVAVGRLSIEKGFHHLIRVFAALAQRQPGIKLLLVGDGPMTNALRAQCIDAGLPMDDMTPGVSAVIFAGYQKNVLPLIALGSVYAMTSATEGFPNVVLEALAAGLRVIAADTPWGVRSILYKHPPFTTAPYPTRHATRAEYGLLMPRIDLPEYQEPWVEHLGALLNEKAPPSTASSTRAQDFDLTIVGQQWSRLIDRLTEKSSALPIIYIFDPTIAVTGAFISARNNAIALKGLARVVLVLPEGSLIPADKLDCFWRVDYVPIVNHSKNLRAMLRYFPALFISSWRLRKQMYRDRAAHLYLNDFYLLQGAMMRLLGYRGEITAWVRCDPKLIAGPLARPMLEIVRLTSDRIVVTSAFMRSLLPPRFKVEIVSNFYTGQTRLPISWRNDQEKPFVYIGNYIQGKGQDIAIQAFAKIADADPTLRLHFYGGDMGLQKNRSYREQLEAMIVQYGLESRVTCNDFLADTYPVLERAYAALNFSWSESFSLTVLEASGAGVPVISTASGGPQEIIRDGITGYLIPVGDVAAAAARMLDLARYPEQAMQLGKAAADHIAQQFSQEAFAAKLRSFV